MDNQDFDIIVDGGKYKLSDDGNCLSFVGFDESLPKDFEYRVHSQVETSKGVLDVTTISSSAIREFKPNNITIDFSDYVVPTNTFNAFETDSIVINNEPRATMPYAIINSRIKYVEIGKIDKTIFYPDSIINCNFEKLVLSGLVCGGCLRSCIVKELVLPKQCENEWKTLIEDGAFNNIILSVSFI